MASLALDRKGGEAARASAPAPSKNQVSPEAELVGSCPQPGACENDDGVDATTVGRLPERAGDDPPANSDGVQGAFGDEAGDNTDNPSPGDAAPLINDDGVEGSNADSGTTAYDEAPPPAALGAEGSRVTPHAPGSKGARGPEGSTVLEPPVGPDEAAPKKGVDDETAFNRHPGTATSTASEAPVVKTPVDSGTTAFDDPGRDGGSTNEKRVGGGGRAAVGSSVMIHMDDFDPTQASACISHLCSFLPSIPAFYSCDSPVVRHTSTALGQSCVSGSRFPIKRPD